MNQKASKQSILSAQTPPLLNMSENRPWVDGSFRNWEKQNTPFINDMMSPVYINDTGNKAVYDKDGHRYEVNSNNYLTRDGLEVQYVQPYHFERTEITEDVIKYKDYYEDDNIKLGSIFTNNNELSFEWVENGTQYNINVGELFVSGILITSRIVVRTADDVTYGIWVGFTNEAGTYKVHYIRFTKDSIIVNNNGAECHWIRMIPEDGTTEDGDLIGVYSRVTIDNPDPVINIGVISDDDGGIFAVSLTSGYGYAMNSKTNGFITLIDHPDMDDPGSQRFISQLGDNLYPRKTSSTPQTVTGTYNNYFRQTYSRKQTVWNGSAISSDGTTFYLYETEGVVGQQLDFGVSYTPTATGNTTTIDGVTYNIYDVSGTKWTLTLGFAIQNYADVNGVWSCTATFLDGSAPISSGTVTDSWFNFDRYVYTFRGQSYPDNPYDMSSNYITWTVNGQPAAQSSDTVLSAVNEWVGVSRDYTTQVSIQPIVFPNVVLDNGNMYSFWGFDEANTIWAYPLQIGGVIIESAHARLSYSSALASTYIAYTAIESVEITDDYKNVRGNSFNVNQNLFQSTVKLCNTGCKVPNEAYQGKVDTTSGKYLEWTNSNANDLRFNPGTNSSSEFNYYGNQFLDNDTYGATEDLLPYTVQGMRVPIDSSSHFNILYNMFLGNTCLYQGISYASDSEHMGTLLTPWQSIDEDFYISAGNNVVVYKDVSNQYWRITIKSGVELQSLLDDRYILVNTTSYYNMYDSATNRMLHYASDYNGRALPGDDSPTTLAAANLKGNIYYVRGFASAINGAYKIQPRIATASEILPLTIKSRCVVNNIKTYCCVIPESSSAQGIDIYFSDNNDTSSNVSVCKYRYTLYPFNVPSFKVKFDLEGSTYQVSSSSNVYLNTDMFSIFIKGAGNNDMVAETYSNYILVYYNTQPYFLYVAGSEVNSVTTASLTGTSSSTSTDGNTAFFVIQGQFYGCINEKLYSLLYNNGAITSMEPIVDIRGYKFVGNNPMIAFFWSPEQKAFYSFTGDANFQPIYKASKFDDIDGTYWYDEVSQSIYIKSSNGLLVFGPHNTYLYENWKDVSLVQFSNDGITHITNGNTTIDLVYYPKEGFEPLDMDAETSFYGLDNTESTSIDRWNITLYDPTESNKSGEIIVGVRSITDITVKSEEKKYKITPEMWDKFSHSILLSYSPKLIKGQGIRLYIKSPFNVQQITPHVMDNNTGTLTRRSM